MGTPVAVEALAALIEEQNSRWADWYDAFCNRVPASVRGRLRPPPDRTRIASRAMEMLGRFGLEAAPAIPTLIRTYQRSQPKQNIRSLAVIALGRIGAAASNAIPVLLPDLHPTNGPFQWTIAGVLARVDPSGDQIDRTLRTLVDRPRHARFAAEIAENSRAALGTVNPANLSFRMYSGQSKWTAAQILGLVRVEAASAVPILITLLNDNEERMRSVAAESLGRLGPAASNALPKLQLLLNDDWAMVRDAATNAIRGIDRRRPQ